MTSVVESKAWDEVAKVVYDKQREGPGEMYTDWAQKYDDDLDALNYETPKNMTSELFKIIENTPSTKIFDIGAGTGKCGEELLKLGYEGIMDALEINKAMLNIAKKKQIYRKHFEMGVYPDKSIPTEDGLYDGVICAGSMGENHIQAPCVLPMTRILKPGGVAIFNCRATDHAKEFRDSVEKELKKLENIKEIKKIEVKEMTHYSSKCRETGDTIMSIVYIFRKL